MNKKITDLVLELGKAIEADPEILKYRQAKNAYYDDMELMTKISEYNALQQKLELEANKESTDEKHLADLEASADEKRNEIYANKTYLALQDSENKINELLNLVNDEIMRSVTGEEPHSCGSGGCSGCGGGCH